MNASFSTCDLYDAFGDSCQICDTQFRQYGGRQRAFGRIRTVRCLGDNLLIRQLLQTKTEGDVLVVDGGGYLGRALMGSTLAEYGRDHGWSGAIILGAIRDVDALSRIDFLVKALGSNPRKGEKHGSGHIDAVVSFGGVSFTPGCWLYSDEDGILVSSRELLGHRRGSPVHL